MKESIEKVKETTESLAAKEEKLDDEINDTCDQLVIEDNTDRVVMIAMRTWTMRSMAPED